MVSTLRVGSRSIGAGETCFVIAEAGVNHNGDIALAKQMVQIAAEAGADAVKFQTFRAETLVSSFAEKAPYQRSGGDDVESQRTMLGRLELSAAAHVELMEAARQSGILFISSPFDELSADFLLRLGVACLKIPSGEITNLPFLEHVASLGVPLILSTGMSSFDEVQTAARILSKGKAPGFALLHCVSNYPADPAACNLRAMATMAKAFHVPVGFSDHTLGYRVALAAVALGAAVIEKHFTMDKASPGPDHRASLDPNELTNMVRGIREVESSLGDGTKRAVPSEACTAAAARKSIVSARPIRCGAQIVQADLAFQRPGTGLPPGSVGRVVGMTAACDIAGGVLIDWEQLR